MNRSDSIIPRSLTTSLTTPDFRWLNAEAWSDMQMEAFLRFRQDGAALRITGSIPFETGKRRVAARVVGRWILEQPTGTPVAAVEAQAFEKVFRTVHLLVSAYDSPDGWRSEQARTALSLMISGTMLLTRSDIVELIPVGIGTAEALVATGWGPVKSVWTPCDPLVLSVGTSARVDLVTLDPHAWWEQDHGAKDRLTLSYLEKRMDAKERREKSLCENGPRRRGGFFGRFSRLWKG